MKFKFGGDEMSEIELIDYAKLVDAIDWDNDIEKWTIGDTELQRLVFKPNAVCAKCRNNPANGGSGICNCILGQIPVTC